MVHRSRVLSAIALALLIVFGALAVAARDAAQAEARAVATDFPQPVQHAATLRLGVNVALEQYDDATLERRLSDLAAAGVTHVRQEFRWTEIEPEKGARDWRAADRIVAAAGRHNVQVLAVLWTTPSWARTRSGSTAFPAIETAPPADPADFAAFAGDFAARYATPNCDALRNGCAILAYQIWDEPNLSAAWGNALINPAEYLRVLKAARVAIRAADPQAILVLGALAPTAEQSQVNLAPQAYLRQLYELGGHDAFDVVAAKPYGFNFPPADRRVDPGVLNFSHALLLRREMELHNETNKSLWITQFGWNALPDDWAGAKSVWSGVTGAQQVDYTRDAVTRAAAEWPWLGGMYLESLQPRPSAQASGDPRWGFALLNPEGAPRPLWTAWQAVVADIRTGRLPAPRAQSFALPPNARPKDEAGPSGYRANPNAAFSTGWRFGELGADVPDRSDARVDIRFTGDDLALIVKRGEFRFRAYLYVTIDGRPANLLPRDPSGPNQGAYLTMTSARNVPWIETIPVASGLGPGEHVATIFADGGWGQWTMQGWSTRTARSAPNYDVLAWLCAALALVAAAGLARAAPRADLAGLARAIGGRIQVSRGITLQAIAAGLALWATAGLSWAQDAATAYRNLGTPANFALSAGVSALAVWAPVFAISIAALIALFVLIWLRLDIGLALAAFFAPFYLVPQRLFERAFSMAELITLICVARWVATLAINLIQARRAGTALPQFKPTLLDMGILGLVGIGLLSSLQSDFKVEAFREWRLVVVEPALLYFMLRSAGLSVGRRNGIAAAFVMGGISIAAVGLWNYARGIRFEAEFGLPRIQSVYGSANNDALYLERAWAMALAGVVFGRWALRSLPLPGGRILRADWLPGAARGAAILGFGVISVALALTQSRGAILFGVPAALVAMCFAAGGRWRWLGAAILAVTAAGAALLLSGAAATLLQGTRLAAALNLSAGSGFIRVNLWQSAWAMWLDHPFLGVGPDNFLYAYRSFYILPAAWKEPELSHAHNLILDPLARIGALGLLALAAVAAGFVARARAALRDDASRPLVIGAFGLAAAAAAHGIVDHSYFLPDLACAFMIAAGLVAGKDLSAD